ncbi:SRPBCC family protein [Flavobacteriaceae bacterium TP-CH-4]|uniref:SRPBCC family protein n=1 Tax=Pelagihabitans pacificus TaxID=2696054 RepID=A0A967ASU9_9FLAO|nr:SRPBCC family protein [Pelagihabitans pacificus]NHF59744.1 SRPBCC family protein [Pelagihabitans pacificus]
MALIKDTIEINAAPTKVFDMLAQLFSSNEDYRKWHGEHVSCKWIKGNPNEVGSILYCEEYLHGKLHRLKTRLTEIEPKRKVSYRFLFPIGILCPEGSFVIEPKGEGSIFTATLSFNFGHLLSQIAPIRIEAIKRHMKEEGENLKALVEMK